MFVYSGGKAELGPFREEVDFFVVKAICEVGDKVIGVLLAVFGIFRSAVYLRCYMRDIAGGGLL